MAELPEITILKQQMNDILSGRTVNLAEALQEKCLNVTPEAFTQAVTGRRIKEVTSKGKWLFFHLDQDYYILLNLGMGADLLYYEPGAKLPAKYQFRMELDDGAGFTCRFWWFGYVRLLTEDELTENKETAKLGPSPMDISADEFAAIAAKNAKRPAKSLILEQDKLSGIGNAYAHDILWAARLHPKRKLGTLSCEEIERYHEGISQIVLRAIEMGGLEPDFYGKGGNMKTWDRLFIVGYKAGKPCPECGTLIEKIKTGSTATFLCPKCQVE